jgi:hypothetical protein
MQREQANANALSLYEERKKCQETGAAPPPKPKRIQEEFMLLHVHDILKDTSVFLRDNASLGQPRKRNRLSNDAQGI